MQGYFIVIEGIDGTGKSTQVGRLADWFRDFGRQVVVSREPTDGPWGRKLRESAATGRLSPEDELEYFLNDRRQHVEEVIAPALAAGKVVILDRYYFSTMAYQGCRGFDPVAIRYRNEEFAPLPDLLLILDLDVDTALARIGSRGDTANEFERRDALERCRGIFLSLAPEPFVRVIPSAGPPDEITARVRHAVATAGILPVSVQREWCPESGLIPPATLLRGYLSGMFPMADDGIISWHQPQIRGLLPLDDNFHISHGLRRALQRQPFEVRWNTAFSEVMDGCANRRETWIDPVIKASYRKLHQLGNAHTVECWDADGLQGGLYGVSLGGAFFGESMFSRKTDASKIALVELVRHLREAGFTLLDTQWSTSHLRTFGCYTLFSRNYHKALAAALKIVPEIPFPQQQACRAAASSPAG
jgi:leucyl/phenylalanyl-tRNA--protein transferase/dTMP kinase